MNCAQARNEMAAAALGQAGTEALRELDEHSASCAGCRARRAAVADNLSRARGCGLGFDLPAGLKDKVLSTLAANPAAAHATFQGRARAWRAMAAVGVCASLTLAAVLIASIPGPTDDDGRARLVFSAAGLNPLDSGAAPASAASDGNGFFKLPAGFSASDPVRFDLPGGVSVALRDARFTLERSRVRLESGSASVSVSPGTPFRVETPASAIEVRGTVFHVEASADRTMVSVDRGRVQVSCGQSQADLLAGQSACASAGSIIEKQHAADPGLCALVLSRDLHLETRLDRSTEPPCVEFLLHNISSSAVLVPAQGPDKPRFSLKFRSAATGFEGVARLPDSPASLASASGTRVPDPLARAWSLGPSEALSVKFDVAAILTEAGDYQVFGVYQSIPPAPGGAWTGQAVSGPLSIKVGPR